MTKKTKQPVVRTYKTERKGKMKRLQFPLILLLHGSCWKVPAMILTQTIDTRHVSCANVTSQLSLMTGQLVAMAAVNPTQQLADVLGTTALPPLLRGKHTRFKK